MNGRAQAVPQARSIPIDHAALRRRGCRLQIARSVFAIVVAMTISLPPLRAEESRTTYLPAVGNLVPALSHSNEWQIDLILRPGLKNEAGAKIAIDLRTNKSSKSFEQFEQEFFARARATWEKPESPSRKSCGVFAYKEGKFLDKPAYFVEKGDCSRPGSNTKPVEFIWRVLLDVGAVLDITFQAHDWDERGRSRGASPEIYAKHKDKALGIVSSLKLLRRDDIGSGTPLLLQYDGRSTRRGVTASRRQRYYLNAFFAFYHFADWRVEQLEASQATSENEIGRFTIGVFENPPPGRQRAIMYIGIEGLKPGALTVQEFLATTPRLMERLGVVTSREAGRREQRYLPFWCVARWSFPRSESTRQTIVRDYDAVDRKGVKWRMRAYTAGGMTVAANLIVAAAPEQFDSVFERTRPLVDSLKLFLESPAIKPFGKCGS